MSKNLIANNEKYNAIIVFRDGKYILAKAIGSLKKVALEICFTTALTGYQEAITDPSYAGQAIIFSFTHIGNAGVNLEDCESDIAYAKAIVVSEKPSLPSNYRSEEEFENWLIKNDVLLIYDVDTRALIQKIRNEGMQNVCLAGFTNGEEIDISYLQQLANEYSYNYSSLMKSILNSNKRNQIIQSIKKKSEQINDKSKKYNILVIDFGVKINILNCLYSVGLVIKDVFPYNYKENIDFSKYDGIVLSNGPGDPLEAYQENPALVNSILESGVPVLGICLGHQIIGIAHPKLKMEVFKMKQGHRGVNHPIKNLHTGIVEITSQNHGFSLRKEENCIDGDCYISHVSLFDHTIAGLYLEKEKIITSQYHPESSAGTHDSRYIFDNFVKMIEIHCNK